MGTRHIAAALGALGVTALLLVGCASGTSNPGSAPGGSSMSVSPSASASASGSGAPGGQSPSGLPSGLTLPPSTRPSGAAGGAQQTLSGQVEAGVEQGCLMLRSGGLTYHLLGGDPRVVYAGAHVSVTGHLVTGVMSYCMQGKPFQVTQAHGL
jgi:hypothetical protein